MADAKRLIATQHPPSHLRLGNRSSEIIGEDRRERRRAAAVVPMLDDDIPLPYLQQGFDGTRSGRYRTAKRQERDNKQNDAHARGQQRRGREAPAHALKISDPWSSWD